MYAYVIGQQTVRLCNHHLNLVAVTEWGRGHLSALKSQPQLRSQRNVHFWKGTQLDFTNTGPVNSIAGHQMQTARLAFAKLSPRLKRNWWTACLVTHSGPRPCPQWQGQKVHKTLRAWNNTGPNEPGVCGKDLGSHKIPGTERKMRAVYLNVIEPFKVVTVHTAYFVWKG